MTKEQFRGQFNTQIYVDKGLLSFDSKVYGYTIYRALNKLVLEDNGEYFIRV